MTHSSLLIEAGLGSMGLAMAMNLQRHLTITYGKSLSFTNRTLSRGRPLEEIGGTAHNSIKSVMLNSDVVFLSVCQEFASGLLTMT